MTTTTQALYRPGTLAEAVAVLAKLGPAAAPIAGATWIMRAPLRDEPWRESYVALSDIAEMAAIERQADRLSIGACVSHARLAEELSGTPRLQVLAQAAAGSANPAVRTMATIGGNLAAADFAAADLVPALLCLDAQVELAGPEGKELLPLERFLARRTALAPGTLIVRVLLPGPADGTAAWRSAHARLPLRVAGDYPVAIVSLAVACDDGGRIADARVAVGAVERVARRWPRLEERLRGGPCDPAAAAQAAGELRSDFEPRDGVEAPGSYRLQVLPALVRRAMAAVAAGETER